MWKRIALALVVASALLVVCTHAQDNTNKLARSASSPNLAADKDKPTLRRTKSAPALLLGFSSIKVVKKEADKKDPKKFKVTVSAKIGAQASKSLLEVDSLRARGRTRGALQAFRKKRAPIPVLLLWGAAGAMSLFIGYKIVKAPRPKGRADFRMLSRVSSSSSFSGGETAADYPAVPKVVKDAKTGDITIKGQASSGFRGTLENLAKEIDTRAEAMPALLKHFYTEMDNHPEVSTEAALKIALDGVNIKEAAASLTTWAKATDTRIAAMSATEKAFFSQFDPFPEMSTEVAAGELLKSVQSFISKTLDDKPLRDALNDGIKQVDAMSRMAESLGGSFDSGSGESDDDRHSSNSVTVTSTGVDAPKSEPTAFDSIPDPSVGVFGTSDLFNGF